MRTKIVFGMLAGLLSALQAAAATCPGTPVLQDSFTAVNPTLNVEPNDSARIAIQGGKAELTLMKATYARAEVYAGMRFGDANVCVTVSTAATDKSEKQDGGIVFWAEGFANYYAFEITPEGMFSVAQKLASGQWSFPIHLTASPAIVQGTGKANTLRVLTKGSTATLFINDQQVGKIDGTPPSGGGMAGFIGDTSDTFSGTDTFDFTNFAVTFP